MDKVIPRCLTGVPNDTLKKIKELLEKTKSVSTEDVQKALDQLIEITSKSIIEEPDIKDKPT